jgi:hypothetical protein
MGIVQEKKGKKERPTFPKNLSGWKK